MYVIILYIYFFFLSVNNVSTKISVPIIKYSTFFERILYPVGAFLIFVLVFLIIRKNRKNVGNVGLIYDNNRFNTFDYFIILF